MSLYKLMKSERSVKKSVYFVRLISEVSSNEALVCFWKTRCRPLLMCGWILKVTRFPSLLFFLIQRSQFILLSQLLSFCSTARVLLTTRANTNVLCVTLTLWRFETIKSNLHSTTEGWVQFLSLSQRLYLKTLMFIWTVMYLRSCKYKSVYAWVCF